MKIYKIWCKYSMGLGKIFLSKEKAIKTLKAIDWIGLTGMTFDEVYNNKIVYIYSLEM